MNLEKRSLLDLSIMQVFNFKFTVKGLFFWIFYLGYGLLFKRHPLSEHDFLGLIFLNLFSLSSRIVVDHRLSLLYFFSRSRTC